MSSSLVGFRGPSGSSPGNKAPSGYKLGQTQNFTPEQMQLFQQLFSNVSPDSFLSKLSKGDEGTFNQIEAPAMRQFQQLQGQNASRFSGLGMGARKGSGFQNFQNQATSDFAQDLSSRRQELQRQALSDLMGISNSLLGQRPSEQYLVQKQQKDSSSGWGGIAGAALGGLGGFFAGGPGGALAGGKLGYNIGSGF